MWLPHALNANTLQVEKDVVVDSYAILSHCWYPRNHEIKEIKFSMLRHADLRDSVKIMGACLKAREMNLDYLWIDSVCMDKDSDAETTKSLNSMFEWYEKADVCLTYLWDVDLSLRPRQPFEAFKPSGQKSKWFMRGWTLQELLAPKDMIFYDVAWNKIGDKKSLLDDLSRATNIDTDYLKGGTKFREASVATRMSWMAGRDTTILEDIAYSMLGILDVKMTPLYGEGTKAFMRLQRELIANSLDESVFAWTSCPKGLRCYLREEAWEPDSWGLLAPSPDCFTQSRAAYLPRERKQIEPRLGDGFRWAQQGVIVDVPQKSGTDATNFFGLAKSSIKFPLNCRVDKDGKPETVILHLVKDGNGYRRVRCGQLDTKAGVKPSSNRVLGIEQIVTRPLLVLQPNIS